jgi:hypothetical protein
MTERTKSKKGIIPPWATAEGTIGANWVSALWPNDLRDFPNRAVSWAAKAAGQAEKTFLELPARGDEEEMQRKYASHNAARYE